MLYTDEELIEYNKLSVKDRIKWLNDIILFKWLIKENEKFKKSVKEEELFKNINLS